MKASNLGKDLVVSYQTFDNLIIPILALNQLFNALFADFAAGTMNIELGSRRSLTFFHRHFWAMVV